jgi:thiamine pyrophosphate-dependent acetolactate synthase large subunit-like protein
VAKSGKSPEENSDERAKPSNQAREAKKGVDRRGFLTGAAASAAAGAAALVTTVPGSGAQSSPAAAPGQLPAGGAAPPTPGQVERDAGNVTPPVEVRAVRRPGSDLMVQVLKDMGVEYVASNPGSSFEGLQESIANYGNPPNTMPEFITALHEETSVDMAHGYGKAEGRPMAALLHGTIGIQHAAMAIYQTYHDETPALLLAGRDVGFIGSHSANDMAAMVRSYTKWDALPTSLEGSLRAIQEGYRQAITPPAGPTLVILDLEFQKEEAGDLAVPAYAPPQITAVDPTTAREIAQGLLAATNPRIQVGGLRTPEGVRLAVELAELVGASTSTSATGGSMSFPQTHPLCGPGAATEYDYTLGLESGGQVSLRRAGRATMVAERDTIGIGFNGIGGGGGGGGRGGRGGGGTTLDVDAEASLPAILEEVRRLRTADNERVAGERAAGHEAANRAARVQAVSQAVQGARIGWDATPVSTARIYAELWPLIMNEDWCLASPSNFSGGHHSRLWEHNKPYSYLGGQGAGGMGYGAGAAGGAGLAAKHRGRIVINIQTDGDLNYTPGVLWSAVHHKLPILTIMHNNRAWHQELMFLEYMAGVRGRGTDRAHIGTTLRNPDIDYKKMAEAYGMDGEGPITDPTQLAAAFRRGVNSVKRGEPYMIDVLTQPR